MKKLIVLLTLIAFCFSSCGILEPLLGTKPGDDVNGGDLGTEETPGDDNTDDEKPEEKPMCAHSATTVANVVVPTCTLDGYTGDRVCADCGEILRTGVAIDKIAHSFYNGECTACGAVDETYNPPVQCTHETTVLVGVLSADCTTEGYTGDVVCESCGVLLRVGVALEKAAHSFVDGACSACGAVDEGYTPPVVCAHTVHSLVGALDATCSAEGYTGDDVCTDCGITLRYGIAIEKIAHSFAEGSCVKCGEIDNSYVPPCTHTQTDVVNEISATCTLEGYTGNEVCVLCGIIVRMGVATPKTAHTDVNGQCSVCGEILVCINHTDVDDNGYCDDCDEYVIVVVDFYAINDLHGKVLAGDTQSGVGPLTTYLKSVMTDNSVLLSSGDMWQGSSESNLTYGALVTEWMNELGFVSMTLGNHEYDWGESYISANAELAEFPLLAINVYDSDTNQRVDYAAPSVVVSRGGVEIGIIGAIGDCYSSISGAVSDGFYFKTGNELANLVKAEAERLRADGVDFIVYSLHDDDTAYQTVLSTGYVDLVFEAHTHQSYVSTDNGGIYHLQGGGENKGLSYVLVSINSANGNSKVTGSSVIKSSTYSSYADDPIVEELLEKYADQISGAYEYLGYNRYYRDDSDVEQLVADLYYQYGLEKWGDQYDIVLGGGFVKTRNPYNLYKGDITYSDVYSLLPFDNALVLCSIKGSDLKSKFINTTNSDYYISYGNYDLSTIENNKTYYIVTDNYTSTYAPNKLTEIDVSNDSIYARDLVADFIRKGGWA